LTKYCPKCGKNNNDNSTFCNGCGERLSVIQGVHFPKDSSFGNKTIIGVIIVLAVILAVIGTYVFVSMNKPVDNVNVDNSTAPTFTSFKSFNTHDYTYKLPSEFTFQERTQDDLFTTYRYKSDSDSSEVLVKILKPKYRNMGYTLYGLMSSYSADFGFSDGILNYETLGAENVLVFTPNNGVKSYISSDHPQITIVTDNVEIAEKFISTVVYL